MFKLIGSSIIMLSATYMGMRRYYDFHERRRILHDIRDGGVRIQNNLRCMCMPLYECFLTGGEFFLSVAEEMKKGSLPPEAVRTSSEKLYPLKKEDMEVIRRFADGLCAADCAGQISNTELFIKGLDARILDAERELSTRGKLFVKGSILSAAAVILLLI